MRELIEDIHARDPASNHQAIPQPLQQSDLEMLDQESFERLVTIALARRGWPLQPTAQGPRSHVIGSIKTPQGTFLLAALIDPSSKELTKALGALTLDLINSGRGLKGAVAIPGKLDEQLRNAWPPEIPLVLDAEWFAASFHSEWPTWTDIIQTSR